MIQPMFQVQLVPGDGGHFVVKVAEDHLAGQRPASGHAVQVGAGRLT